MKKKKDEAGDILLACTNVKNLIQTTSFPFVGFALKSV